MTRVGTLAVSLQGHLALATWDLQEQETLQARSSEFGEVHVVFQFLLTLLLLEISKAWCQPNKTSGNSRPLWLGEKAE